MDLTRDGLGDRSFAARHEPLPLKWGGLQADSSGLRIPLSSSPARGAMTRLSMPFRAPLGLLRDQGFLEASRDASQMLKTLVV